MTAPQVTPETVQAFYRGTLSVGFHSEALGAVLAIVETPPKGYPLRVLRFYPQRGRAKALRSYTLPEAEAELHLQLLLDCSA